MNEIEKVSDITYQDVATYLRLAEVSESDQNYLTTLINVAITYICNYTGLAESDLDSYADLIIVVFVLCQDMYDTRALYVENTNLNNVVETILGMHSINLLPVGDSSD